MNVCHLFRSPVSATALLAAIAFCFLFPGPAVAGEFSPSTDRPVDRIVVEKAKRTQQQLIAMGMKGTALEANDGYGLFVAPKNDKILHGSGKQAVVRLVSREVIEQVAWEVVPDLAEAIIREQLQALLKE